MIIVRLNGGLGNQLFQYAAGKSLSIINNDILKLDVADYYSKINQKQINRSLDITDFMITASQADSSETFRIKYPYGILSKITRNINQKFFSRYYVDWHPQILRQKGDVYLDGYFQTEKYFFQNNNEILKEFILKPDFSRGIEPHLNVIKATRTPISLHIRRGDFSDNPKTREHHLVCDVNFYRRAISFMQEKFPGLHLFIFSDDPGWVRENLLISVPYTIVSADRGAENSLRASQELVLISKCSHHILSNSSFSWWGAYLNKSEAKIVLAPNIWIKGPISQPNILAQGWVPFSISE